MADSIHQLSMKYIVEHDRILFRLGTLKNTEYQMWFTRRFINLLWKKLQQQLSLEAEIFDSQDNAVPGTENVTESKSIKNQEITHQQPTKKLSSEAKEALLGMQHQEAIQDTNFKKPHKKDNTVLTKKTGPLLISNVFITQEKENITSIRLVALGGAKIQFGLTKKLLHAFCQLLISSTNKAKWDLNLAVGDGNIVPPSQNNKSLH